MKKFFATLKEKLGTIWKTSELTQGERLVRNSYVILLAIGAVLLLIAVIMLIVSKLSILFVPAIVILLYGLLNMFECESIIREGKVVTIIADCSEITDKNRKISSQLKMSGTFRFEAESADGSADVANIYIYSDDIKKFTIGARYCLVFKKDGDEYSRKNLLVFKKVQVQAVTEESANDINDEGEND